MQVLELTIEKIVPGGRGLGFHEGRAVFVPFTVPGEIVRVEVIKTHKNYLDGRLLEVITPGPGRITPECAVFTKCGGCQLQQLSIQTQAEIKHGFVAAALERIGRVDPENILHPILASTSPMGYRIRAGLKVRVVNGQLLLGFFQPNSHRIVDLPECRVLDPRLAALIRPLREFLSLLSAKSYIPQVDMAAGEQGVHIVMHTLRHFSATDIDKCRVFCDQTGLAQLWMQQGRKEGMRHLAGEVALSYRIEDYALTFQPGDFIQVNGFENRKLVAKVMDCAGQGKLAWDLFCGIGNFTLPLSKRFENVVGVESFSPAVQRLRQNVSHMNVNNIQALHADLFTAEGLDRLAELAKPDLIVLDPPRTGAADLLKRITRWAPVKIVYVSCDPATFARDVAIIKHQGGELQSVQPFDFFPHTKHVELVAVFQWPTHKSTG